MKQTRSRNVPSKPVKLSKTEFTTLAEVSARHDFKSPSYLDAIALGLTRDAQNISRAASIVRSHPRAWEQFKLQGGHIPGNGHNPAAANGEKPRETALPLNPPLAGRLKPLFEADADAGGRVQELIVNLPEVQVFRDADGYIVDREVGVDIKVDGSGDYSVIRRRTREDHLGALKHILTAALPAEFLSMITVLFEDPSGC